MDMSGMQSAEQTLNMSPMDLFDSIFWGKLHFLFPLDCIGTDQNQTRTRPSGSIPMVLITHNHSTLNSESIGLIHFLRNLKSLSCQHIV